MRRLSLKPRARLDLLEIWNHLAEESFDAAKLFNAEVDASLEKITEFPGLGHRRSDVKSPRLRFWGVYSWLIVYRYDDENVVIIRVIHGRRKLRSLLKGQN